MTPSSNVAWNPADYAAHSMQQQSWARELIARLHLRGDEHIVDVGCGDGKVTAEIGRAVPHGSVVGIDASPDMIEFAARTFPPTQASNLSFRIMDAREIRFERQFDLLFSNAALHWISDHRRFLHGAGRCLRPGARLVVSCGGKGNAQEIFNALRPTLRLKQWRPFFRKMEAPYFFYAPEQYAAWLPEAGFKPVRVQLAPKDATHKGASGLADWLRTTWLPYTQRVPEQFRDEFIAAVVERYVSTFPPDSTGLVHVHMVRLEIEAERASNR